jgi:hypothetical protein
MLSNAPSPSTFKSRLEEKHHVEIQILLNNDRENRQAENQCELENGGNSQGFDTIRGDLQVCIHKENVQFQGEPEFSAV